jgi:hypothetical protein
VVPLEPLGRRGGGSAPSPSTLPPEAAGEKA